MSLIIDPDNEDFEEVDSEPYFLEEYDTSESDNEDDPLLKIDKWIYFYSVDKDKTKYSCNILLPSPKLLGLEKTYEICKFLIEEINALILKSEYEKSDKLLLRGLNHSLFIIEQYLYQKFRF